MIDPLLESWQVHCRLSLEWLETIPEVALVPAQQPKGRKVAEILAHMHHNRIAWLEASTPDLVAQLPSLPKDEILKKEVYLQALRASAKAVDLLLERGLASSGKIKAFPRHAASFIGYLISHDAYHHGEIGFILTHAGFKLDRKSMYALWNWGKG